MAIEEDMREHFAALSGPDTQLHIGSSMFFCTYVLPGCSRSSGSRIPRSP